MGKKKLDLDALGYNENFTCPKCKKMISFYYFIDKFATQVGSVKEVLEQDFNADPDFAEYVFEINEFDEELDEHITDYIRKRFKKYYKDYKQGKKYPHKIMD